MDAGWQVWACGALLLVLAFAGYALVALDTTGD